MVGELHRQRSKFHVRTTANSRILGRLTASPEQAIQRRRVGTSQIRQEPTRTMQPGRSHDYRLCRRVDGTHIEQPSTNIDLERQTANGARHSGRDQGNRPGCSRVRPGGPNATVEASVKQRTGATAVDMRLEIVACPFLMWTGPRTATSHWDGPSMPTSSPARISG